MVKPQVKVPVKSVKVGCYDVPIKLVPDNGSSEMREAIGLFDPITLEITVCDYLPEQRMKKTVCHEICHAMAFAHHVPMPDDIESMELINDTFATAMYAFIRDNPELVKWIQKNK